MRTRTVGIAVLVLCGVLLAACAERLAVAPEPEVSARAGWLGDNFEAMHPPTYIEREQLLARLDAPGGEEWAVSQGFRREWLPKWRRWLSWHLTSEILPPNRADPEVRARLLARLNAPGGEEWAVSDGLPADQVEMYRRYLSAPEPPPLKPLPMEPAEAEAVFGRPPWSEPPPADRCEPGLVVWRIEPALDHVLETQGSKTAFWLRANAWQQPTTRMDQRVMLGMDIIALDIDTKDLFCTRAVAGAAVNQKWPRPEEDETRCGSVNSGHWGWTDTDSWYGELGGRRCVDLPGLPVGPGGCPPGGDCGDGTENVGSNDDDEGFDDDDDEEEEECWTVITKPDGTTELTRCDG